MNRHFIYNIFSKIPILETERLTLRRMRISDDADMFDYARRADVTEYLLWDAHRDMDQTREYLQYIQKQYEEGEFYDWAIVLRENGKMIGTCGFTSFDDDNNAAEVGYVVNPDYSGVGIASEALSEILKFGFLRLNLHRITARYMDGNEASRRVMEKCGMSFEGTHRSSLYVKGAYHTVSVCAILRDEFLSARARAAEEEGRPFLKA